MSTMNRLATATNPYQGNSKKVLCVCSAGLLRSPTTAVVLAKELGFNTRAAGLSKDYALIPVDDVLLTWADEIVCMDMEQSYELAYRLKELKLVKPIVCLGIPDQFRYMDPNLVELIMQSYTSEKVVLAS